MTERLQKIISSHGVMSRRAAEQAIADGRVTVNGVTAHVGDKADDREDRIEIDGKVLSVKADSVYIMLNKPRGYVTTLSDEKGRKNAAELVSDCGVRVYPVGRLDMDSEGLLLFTNDGEFANKMMHPSSETSKVYKVTVEGDADGALARLAMPFELDGYITRPAEVELLKQKENGAVLLVTIHEGRNRQVRRMCAECGLKVLRLVRVAEGAVLLGKLPTGSWRYLTHEEMTKLNAE